MGARARTWLWRVLGVLAVISGVVLVLGLPGIPFWARPAFLAIAALVGGAVAFRQIPAFDLLGRVHWRLPKRRERVCAITFDDGPSASTSRVVEILDRFQTKATFFVLAANARRHPDMLRLLVERGHTVGIHGVTHRKVHRDSEVEVTRELEAAIDELSALGAPPAPLYRAPHGLKSGATLRAVRKLGLELWAWSRGVWDTDRPPAEVLVRRATRLACSRMVLLLHDGRGNEEHVNVEPMLSALPHILERLRDRGFAFRTLDRA